MGLKCSVLGHKYGDATVERDREEQGSEVVITIREIEACRRCGEERIVSENKEVTTLATPDEPDAVPEDGATDEASDDGVSADKGHGEPSSVGDDDATIVDDVTADAKEDSADDGSFASEVPEGTEDSDGSAVEESPPVEGAGDAEILDAEGGDAVGDEQVADDELADPSIEDAGFTTDSIEENSVEEDAVIIDDEEDEPDEETGRQPGAWPEEPDGDGADDWTPSDALDEDGPITAPDAGTENNAAVTIPDGQFRCPECGYTTLVEDSSLRAGDFCPDCRKGSLVHEPRDGTRKE